MSAGDIGLYWNELAGDLQLRDGDLWRDGGLETAIVISLFTDRRASPSDVLPDASPDRRGWWGDGVPEIEGDEIGSHLWLLAREKELPVVVERAREYAQAALQWLIDDRVAERVEVTAEIVRPGFLGILAVIWRPQLGRTEYRFNYNWDAQAARRG